MKTNTLGGIIDVAVEKAQTLADAFQRPDGGLPVDGEFFTGANSFMGGAPMARVSGSGSGLPSWLLPLGFIAAVVATVYLFIKKGGKRSSKKISLRG